jgi:ABC-type phosphate transport system substrate-binding protein
MNTERTRRRFLGWLWGGLSAAVLATLSPAPVESGELELAVIVNASNTNEIKTADIDAIFKTSITRWADGAPLTAFNLPPQTDPRTVFDRAVLRMEPDDAARFWIDRKVRGGDPPPRQVPDPTLMVRVVAQLKGAIGYAPIDAVGSGVRIVARVRGGKLIKP